MGKLMSKSKRLRYISSYVKQDFYTEDWDNNSIGFSEDFPDRLE